MDVGGPPTAPKAGGEILRVAAVISENGPQGNHPVPFTLRTATAH